MERPPHIADLLKNPWVRIGLELAIVVAIVWLLHRLQGVLTPLLVGLVLAYMLDPLVNLLTAGKNRHFSRLFASTVVFGTGGLLLLATLLIGVPRAWQEGAHLYRIALIGDEWNDVNQDGAWQEGEQLFVDHNQNSRGDPSNLTSLHAWLRQRGLLKTDEESTDAEAKESAWFKAFDPEKLRAQWWDALVTSVQSQAGGPLAKIGAILGNIGWWMLTLLLIPVYGYFFSVHLPHVSQVIVSHIPSRHRDKTVSILSQIHQVVGAFFRGRMLICLILGVLAVIGFSVAGVRSALVLGLLLGLATAIPLAVNIIMIPVFALLYLNGADPWQYWVAGGTFVLIQGLEPLLITVIMGKGVELHPVIVLVAILAFGTLMGPVGILLAVPLAATARILLREYLYPQLRQMAGLDNEGTSRYTNQTLS
jgi:predicted PurR-regulated permease PerM